MIDPSEFCDNVIEPTLTYLDMRSVAAVNLMIGTALTESKLTNLVQGGDGPALGLYQTEPKTHDDIWDNFLVYKPELREKVIGLLVPKFTNESQLIWNLYYATAIARLVYWRRTESLPDAEDVNGLASYWKDHYNTHLGKGKTSDFLESIALIY